MGVCSSSQNAKYKIETEISRAIQLQLTEDHSRSLWLSKFLLLGLEESGKSTILKQLKILHGQGYSDIERREYQKYIHSNVIEYMRTLCRACIILGLEGQVRAKAEFNHILSLTDAECFGPNVCLSPELTEKIRTLWLDRGIQSTWNQRHLIQVPESIYGYFNSLEQISAVNYLPSIEDILNVRVRTSGIVEKQYDIDGNNFLFIDVAGQRNERSKWIHSFDHIDVVIFVVDLSEFDQVSHEGTVNRMVEALSLFDQVCNTYFRRTSIMLLLNKSDLFREKIKTKKLNKVMEFSDFAGDPDDFDECCQYFTKKFKSLNRMEEIREIFSYITCATDTRNIQLISDECRKIIFLNNQPICVFSGIY